MVSETPYIAVVYLNTKDALQAKWSLQKKGLPMEADPSRHYEAKHGKLCPPADGELSTGAMLSY